MKKIFTPQHLKAGLALLFISFFLLSNFSFAQSPDEPDTLGPTDTTLEQGGALVDLSNTPPPTTTNPSTTSTVYGGGGEADIPLGMTINETCLLNGQCKFNIYDALGIRQSVREKGEPTSVGLFVQDIVLAATMFIGTVVTIAIIVAGLMRIFAGATGKDPTKAKSGLINALIGLLIVVSSYLIIRLVQYIAKGF